ncbi:MAG: hypothetical protein CR972_02625 [Candidatus Moraniibacteriota bacterium]|nr:MAG: hypothetical protein CR972_02625 [Candidatus Moranbacteria bacterium]
MKNRFVVYLVVFVMIIVSGACATIIYHMSVMDETHVVFLDIGQGDAILISHGSNQVLIDGGPDGTILLEELGTYMPFWDRTIEIVVATHPDSDHIDGLVGVFEHYHVNQLWYTNADKDTATYKKLLYNANKEKNLEKIIAFYGLQARVGDGLLKVIYPYSSDVSRIEDVNAASITALFEIGNDVFYLGGDITTEFEDKLPIDDKITILKASHHGSNTSTSKKFLQKTNPKDVIISAGVHNRYGHPHKNVLMRIYRTGAQVFRTDQFGSIEYVCNESACYRNE